MDFKALLAALLSEDSLPENWGDQITEAYEFDLSVPNAKVGDLETQLAAKDAEIAALKIRNYELLEYGNTEHDEADEDATEVADEDLTTEDLFTDPEDED